MMLLIGPDHLPVEIEIQPKQGPPVKVEYSDYVTMGKAKYPRKTSVRQDDKPLAVFQLDIGR
jgi:hypothetical protein